MPIGTALSHPGKDAPVSDLSHGEQLVANKQAACHLAISSFQLPSERTSGAPKNMNIGIQHPPEKIDAQILEFCARLCPDTKPRFVQVRPESGTKVLDCHPNVAAKVRRDGGAQIYGWQISVAPRIFLEAQFHSVWKSPDGRLLDITLEEVGHTRILFLEDPRRIYTGTRVPNERFPLGPEDLVSRFLDLSDKSQVILQDLLAGGFRAGDPVFRARLAPLYLELTSIRGELTKDM